MSARSRQRGFTLLEILVATVILAVMGVMAYRGIAEARVAVGNAEGHLDRLRQVQRTMQLVVTDFRTLTPPQGARADRRRLPRDARCATPTPCRWSSCRAAAGRTAPARRAARRSASSTGSRKASSSASTGPSWTRRSRRRR